MFGLLKDKLKSFVDKLTKKDSVASEDVEKAEAKSETKAEKSKAVAEEEKGKAEEKSKVEKESEADVIKENTSDEKQEGSYEIVITEDEIEKAEEKPEPVEEVKEKTKITTGESGIVVRKDEKIRAIPEEKTESKAEQKADKGAKEKIIVQSEEKAQADEKGKEGLGLKEKAKEKYRSGVGLGKKALALITGKIKIEEKDLIPALEELELALIEADVAFDVVEAIIEEIKVKLIGKELSPKEVEKAIKDVIKDTLSQSIHEPDKDLLKIIKASDKRPFVIVFFGVNGVGKTSTIAKMAKLLEDNGLKVSIAAADTFRAAAIEQLEEHAKNLNIDFVKGAYGDHPATIAYNAIEHAKARGIDVVLIDTAGRQDINRNLMKELDKVVRVAKPDLKLFIGESLAGNALYDQVSTYNDVVGIDGIILTKLDLDPKGGTAISASKATGVPIYYITVGQGYDDIKPFTKEWLIDRVLW